MQMQHTNTTSTSETKKQEAPWYKQPETTETIVEAPVSASPLMPATQTTTTQPQGQQALFEASEAQQILARASALQEIHGQLLSPEQIEAIAAEIGVKPEFVHLAIEQDAQEKSGGATQPVAVSNAQARYLTGLRVTTTMMACALVAASYTALDFIDNLNGHDDLSEATVIIGALVFPLLLSFSLGMIGRSNRWGAVSGSMIALTTIAAVLVMNYSRDVYVPLESPSLVIFTVVIATSAFVGAAGAEARRIVSRRQTSNRNRNKRAVRSA